ncbi:YciI family protein [Miltoncostaea marina]|uniref:YciI family protein n=1 Tax=Miltoncostaea marina TaxID=2843215 RepID=UPI001C3C5587|nr:YciI family protein [Miltoncostaea marina]
MTAGPHTVLLYDYVADVVERRAPHREAHLAWIREWVDGGSLLSAGALGAPPAGALFVFGDVPAGEVERFADGDPYRAAGLVAGRRVLPWTVVAAAP